MTLALVEIGYVSFDAYRCFRNDFAEQECEDCWVSSDYFVVNDRIYYDWESCVRGVRNVQIIWFVAMYAVFFPLKVFIAILLFHYQRVPVDYDSQVTPGQEEAEPPTIQSNRSSHPEQQEKPKRLGYTRMNPRLLASPIIEEEACPLDTTS